MMPKQQQIKVLNLLQRYTGGLTPEERAELFLSIGVKSENTMYKYLREPKLLSPPQRDVLAERLGRLLKVEIKGSDLYKSAN